jgi:hypothetical protein
VSMQVYLQLTVISVNVDSNDLYRIRSSEITVLKPAMFSAQLPSWARIRALNWKWLTITNAV